MNRSLVALVLLAAATSSSAQHEQNPPPVIQVVIQGGEKWRVAPEVVKVLQSKGYTVLEPVVFEVLQPCALPQAPDQKKEWTAAPACLAKATSPGTDYLLLAVAVDSEQSLSNVYTKDRFGSVTGPERRKLVTSTSVYFSLVDIAAKRPLKNGHTFLARKTSTTWTNLRQGRRDYTESIGALESRAMIEMAKDVPQAPKKRR